MTIFRSEPRGRGSLLPKLLIGLAVLVVAVAGAFDLMRARPGETVRAIGGEWEVRDVSWTQTDDHWRVAASFAPHSVRLSATPVSDLLKSFCGVMLTSLPDKPSEGITRDAVYRVDLNYLSTEGQLLHRTAIPVPVVDGGCVLNMFGDTFFPLYPGRLAEWFVADRGMQKLSDDRVVRAVIFRERPGADADVDSFPFALACDYVRNDPIARASVQSADGKVIIPEIRMGEELAVVAREGQPGSLLQFGRYRSEVFVLTDAGCDEVAA